MYKIEASDGYGGIAESWEEIEAGKVAEELERIIHDGEYSIDDLVVYKKVEFDVRLTVTIK